MDNSIALRFHAKDPISALTHFIGFIGAVLGMPLLLSVASARGCSALGLASLAAYGLSKELLYGASTAYHSFSLDRTGSMILKKIDHMSIFVLIAGSYTPFCVIVLPKNQGIPMFFLMWGLAAAGILFKALWVTCPKWVSSVIYIVMGWAALLVIGPLHARLSSVAFALLVLGGVWYTIGGVVYSLKLAFLEKRWPGFGAHELFHVFVLLGSFTHYLLFLGFLF